QPHAAVVLAIDIRVEGVAIALVGLGGQILGRNSWNLYGRSSQPDEVVTHVVESTKWLVGELSVETAGVGVSVPGVVRRSDGLVHEAPNLHWTDVPLGEWLSTGLGMPVSAQPVTPIIWSVTIGHIWSTISIRRMSTNDQPLCRPPDARELARHLRPPRTRSQGGRTRSGHAHTDPGRRRPLDRSTGTTELAGAGRVLGGRGWRRRHG
ncbi:ROK family protein, partial [Kibdelosporangium lantanae]